VKQNNLIKGEDSMNFIQVLKGIASGIIYISSFFWTVVLTFKYSDMAIIIVLLSTILTNIVVGLLMASKSHHYTFYKWLISLPAGILTFLAYRQTNFINYWLNKIYPEYGDLSAGGGFALLFYMVFYLLSFFIAITIAICITNQKSKQLLENK